MRFFFQSLTQAHPTSTYPLANLIVQPFIACRLYSARNIERERLFVGMPFNNWIGNNSSEMKLQRKLTMYLDRLCNVLRVFFFICSAKLTMEECLCCIYLRNKIWVKFIFYIVSQCHSKIIPFMYLCVWQQAIRR